MVNDFQGDFKEIGGKFINKIYVSMTDLPIQSNRRVQRIDQSYDISYPSDNSRMCLMRTKILLRRAVSEKIP